MWNGHGWKISSGSVCEMEMIILVWIVSQVLAATLLKLGMESRCCFAKWHTWHVSWLWTEWEKDKILDRSFILVPDADAKQNWTWHSRACLSIHFVEPSSLFMCESMEWKGNKGRWQVQTSSLFSILTCSEWGNDH